MGRETILHPAEQSCPKTRDSALFRLTIAYWLQPYGNMSKNMQQKLRRHAVEYHMGITYICSISVENASMKFVIGLSRSRILELCRQISESSASPLYLNSGCVIFTYPSCRLWNFQHPSSTKFHWIPNLKLFSLFSYVFHNHYIIFVFHVRCSKIHINTYLSHRFQSDL